MKKLHSLYLLISNRTNVVELATISLYLKSYDRNQTTKYLKVRLQAYNFYKIA